MKMDRLWRVADRYRVVVAAVFISLLNTSNVFSATWDKVALSGYLSMEYEKNIGGDEGGDTNGSFDLDLIDLVLNIQVTNKLRIAADFTWEHGAASEDDRGNVAVEYAFAEYTVGGQLKIRAGKMFTNFGIYNEVHTAKPATLTVKEPQSTNKNNKLGSEIRFYPRWLVGVAMLGNYSNENYAWDYVLQLSNGESEDDDSNPFEADDNTHKAVNGRFRFRPFDTLQLGFSFYVDQMENLDTGGEIDLNSYGVQAEWESEEGTGLEFEYVMGDENYSLGSNTSRSAYTLMAFQRLGDRYTPYVRYEYLEPDDDTDDDEASVTILGVNILVEDNIFVKVEVDQFSTKDNNAAFNGDSFTEFKVSLSIGF